MSRVDLNIAFDSYGNMTDRALMAAYGYGQGTYPPPGSVPGGTGAGTWDFNKGPEFNTTRSGAESHRSQSNASRRTQSPMLMTGSRPSSPLSMIPNDASRYSSSPNTYQNQSYGDNDKGVNQYYRMSDDGHSAVRYPDNIVPLVIRSRPSSPDRPQSPSAISAFGRDTFDSRDEMSYSSKVGDMSHRSNKGDKSNRSNSPGRISFIDNGVRGIMKTNRGSNHQSYSPPPSYLPPPRPVPITPHQIYEYNKAIKAIRSIRDGIRSRKSWLYDPDIGTQKIVSMPVCDWVNDNVV